MKKENVVLIVEDYEPLRKLLTAVVRSMGLTPVPCGTIRGGLAFLSKARQSPALVVTGYQFWKPEVYELVVLQNEMERKRTGADIVRATRARFDCQIIVTSGGGITGELIADCERDSDESNVSYLDQVFTREAFMDQIGRCLNPKSVALAA